jgi:hypothetical protein
MGRRDGSGRVTVEITFQPPSRVSQSGAPSFHQRSIEDVPASVAEKMVRDFRAGADNSSEAPSWELYRYEENGEERLVPLDFGEVVDLTLDESR